MSNQRRPLGEISTNTVPTSRKTVNKLFQELQRPLPPVLHSHSLDEGHHPHVEDAEDIFDHFLKKETRYRPMALYMNRQHHIDEIMRTTLVDWLVDVHRKFELSPETLHLAVDIIDRFLNSKVVLRPKLQLVGVVALLISAKYEEVYTPEVKDYIDISAKSYTRGELLRMERLVLKTIKFRLTVPTLYQFLCRGLQLLEADSTTVNLTNYLGELSLLDSKFLSYLPSTISAACLYLARRFLQVSDAWDETLVHFMHRQLSEVELCAQDLLDLVKSIPTHKSHAISRKYSYTKYGEVAKMALNEIGPLLESPEDFQQEISEVLDL